MPPSIQLRRSRSVWLLVVLGGATASIVCACAAAIIWILNVSSASLDNSELESERRMLHTAISSYQLSGARSLADLTSWTELYDNLRGPRSGDWERDNLGPYLVTNFDIDRIMIVSKSGALVYSFARPGAPVAAALSAADEATVRRLNMAAFQAERPDAQIAVSGVTELEGSPSLAFAATIRTTSLKGPSQFSLVEVRSLSDGFLSKFGVGFGIAHLRARRRSGRGLALPGIDGTVSGYELAWQPLRPGKMLLARAVPVITIVGLATAAALLGLVAVLWSVMRNIRSGEERILRAELETSRVRAIAAEETSRSKSAFIANMSHELRTPLNAIIGFSQMIATQLAGPIGSPKYLAYAENIHDSGNHLLSVVNDLLELSKLDAGKFQPRLEAVKVAKVVDETMRMMAVLAEKRDLSLDLTLDPEAEVLADRQALFQILTNIFSNAIKFSCEGGEIRVCVTQDEHSCDIRIEDHGCGIPPETLKELGKPFVQAEDVYSRTYQGTGLGLAICFRFAEAMGAKLEIASEVGSGTAVTLRLRRPPCAESATLEDEAA